MERPKNTSAPCSASARVRAARLGGEALLVGIHALLAALVQDALGVAHQDVLAPHAQPDVVLRARDGAGAGAVENHTHFARCACRRASSAFSKAAPEMMAVPCWSSWKTGIFMVRRSSSSMRKHSGALMSSRLMPPKVGSSNWQVRMISCGSSVVELDIEDVDIREAFEQHRLAFHHGLARQRADVAQAQHGGSIGDDRDQISFRRCTCKPDSDRARSPGTGPRRRACTPGSDRAGSDRAWWRGLRSCRRAPPSGTRAHLRRAVSFDLLNGSRRGSGKRCRYSISSGFTPLVSPYDAHFI